MAAATSGLGRNAGLFGDGEGLNAGLFGECSRAFDSGANSQTQRFLVLDHTRCCVRTTPLTVRLLHGFRSAGRGGLLFISVSEDFFTQCVVVYKVTRILTPMTLTISRTLTIR